MAKKTNTWSYAEKKKKMENTPYACTVFSVFFFLAVCVEYVSLHKNLLGKTREKHSLPLGYLQFVRCSASFRDVWRSIFAFFTCTIASMC